MQSLAKKTKLRLMRSLRNFIATRHDGAVTPFGICVLDKENKFPINQQRVKKNPEQNEKGGTHLIRMARTTSQLKPDPLEDQQRPTCIYLYFIYKL